MTVQHQIQNNRNFWMRPEGRILLAGFASIFLYVICLGLSLAQSTEYFQNVLSLTATRLVIGRPGGVYFGHVLNFSYTVNICVNFFVDIVAVFLFYPLFVLSMEGLHVFRSLDHVIKRVHKTAKLNYKAVKIYGIPGLILFVLFPMWGTGPVVGCVIGYLMGLKHWINMAIVLGATFLAIIIWTVVLAEFHLKLLRFSIYTPAIVIGVLFLTSIGMVLWGYVIKKK